MTLPTPVEKMRRRVWRTRAFQGAHRRLGLETPAIRRPIFLVGTVRSGTTFFARCIADHPEVVNAGFELSHEWHQLAGIDIATPGVPCAHCPAAGPEAVAGRGEEVRAGFARLHLVKGGWKGTRLFNKSPHLWNKLPLVRALFPDAVLLVTSRDIRSTVASAKRLWEKMFEDWGVRHFLPRNPTACWSCSPPAPETDLDPARLFPGGDAAVLAEYWLRVYETIDREAGTFETALPVRHADFVADPEGVLRRVESEAGLRRSTYPGFAEMQRDRNQRWRKILTEAEQESLERFLAASHERMAGLLMAETGVEAER